MDHLPESIDFTVEDQGTIYLLRPHSHASQQWIEQNLSDNTMYEDEAVIIKYQFDLDILLRALEAAKFSIVLVDSPHRISAMQFFEGVGITQPPGKLRYSRWRMARNDYWALTHLGWFWWDERAREWKLAPLGP